MQLIENLPYAVDAGLAARARIGLVVLASDHTIEQEWRRIFYAVPGVGLFQNRIANVDQVTPQSLRDMAPRITDSVRMITPGTPLDVVAYACTSASIAIGEAAVCEHIRRAAPQAKCSTPISAAVAAFKAFGAQRIGVLTPYSTAVNQLVAEYLTTRGFSVPIFASFNQEYDSKVAMISPTAVQTALENMREQADVDAMFVSCTSLRFTFDCERLEAQLGCGLTSSNHALAWHCLRLAGIEDHLPGLGSLYSL